MELSQSSRPSEISDDSLFQRSARLPSELCPFAQKTPRESLDVRTHARHDGRGRRRCVTISRAAYRRGLSPGPRLSCHVVRDAPRPNLGITADRVSPPEIAQLTRTRRPRPTRISPRMTPGGRDHPPGGAGGPPSEETPDDDDADASSPADLDESPSSPLEDWNPREAREICVGGCRGWRSRVPGRRYRRRRRRGRARPHRRHTAPRGGGVVSIGRRRAPPRARRRPGCAKRARATDPFTGRVTAVTSTPSPPSSPPARRSIAAVISPTRRFTWRAPRAATRWRGCCWREGGCRRRAQRLSDHPAGHRDGRDDAGCGEICGAQRGRRRVRVCVDSWRDARGTPRRNVERGRG